MIGSQTLRFNLHQTFATTRWLNSIGFRARRKTYPLRDADSLLGFMSSLHGRVIPPFESCLSVFDFSINAHWIVWPPSITIAWPIMKAASSEQSQMTAAAISSGVPMRPTGSSAITLARPSGVPPVKRPIMGVSM
jgi:hypothetical protein